MMSPVVPSEVPIFGIPKIVDPMDAVRQCLQASSYLAVQVVPEPSAAVYLSTLFIVASIVIASKRVVFRMRRRNLILIRRTVQLVPGLLLMSTLILLPASQGMSSEVAFDYLVDNNNSHLVNSWLSVSALSGDSWRKYATSYQPSQSEYIDHFSALMLGELFGTPPTSEADWALLNGLWHFQIWSVPADAPPVDTHSTLGVIPAIVNEYWHAQPSPPDVDHSVLLTPVGGIPSRAGLWRQGQQKWLADFDLNQEHIRLDPGNVYMLELSVIGIGAPIFIFETDTSGPARARNVKSPDESQALVYPQGTPAIRMTTNAVPEPTTLILALCGLLGCFYLRGNQRHA